jgi:hypothetical protein
MRPIPSLDDALLRRLPLPLTQLGRRAANARDPLALHLTAYYLWEAALKLLGSAAVVVYAERPEHDPALVECLQNLARPALGQWWEIVRRLTPVLAEHDAGFAAVRDFLLGKARDDVWKYFDAEQQKGIALQNERKALQEADKAKKARDFLVSIFRISERGVQDGNTTAREILADAERRIPLEFADQEDLRADLLGIIGEVKRGIGRTIPQAMILEVRGAVNLQSHQGTQKRAVPQALLHLDDRLTLGPDARAQLVFSRFPQGETSAEPGSDHRLQWLRPGGCDPGARRQRDDDVRASAEGDVLHGLG